MKVLSFREITKIMRENGFELKRISSSHYYFSNGSQNIPVPIKLKPIISTKIVKQLKLISVK